MLRLPPAVRQGQTVKVVSGGDAGFRVTSEGRALNGAADGEPVRVRMSTGQVLSGTARNGGVVEVRY
jgi:flagella basal body P-ring formation protein FlgA